MANTKQEIEALIPEWCKENIYTLYADRDDQLPIEMAEKILEATTDAEVEEAIWNVVNEIDDNLLDYRWEVEQEQFKQFLKENDIEIDSKSEESEILDTFREYFEFNSWDYIKSIFAAAGHIHIVATPLFEGEPLEAPCIHDYDETYNAELSERLIKVLGISKDDAEQLGGESMYSQAFLRICGTIDFSEIFEKRKLPKVIRFDKNDSQVWHNAWNGSGSCWEPEIPKQVDLPCQFRVDNNWKYGVDAVYGMSGSFWRSQLTLMFEDDLKAEGAKNAG